MAGRLHQILTFTNVAPAGQMTIAHDIRWNARPVIPDWIIPQQGNGAFTVVACTSTALTIQNDEAAPATFVFWLLSHHSLTREFNNVSTQFLTPLPFVLGGGGGGSAPAGSSNIVVWHNDDVWTDVYAEIVAIRTAEGGPIICYVEPNVFGDPIPAITPADVYNINDVQFVSIYSLGSGILGAEFVTILVEDGVTFEPSSDLDKVTWTSVNIRWEVECTTTPLVTGAATEVRLNFIGQGARFGFALACSSGVGGLAFNIAGLDASLVGYSIIGTPFGTGLISATGSKNVAMTGSSSVASYAFDDGANVGIDQDSTSLFDATDACFTNPTSAVVNLLDAATRVSYSDTLATGFVSNLGSLDAETVQQAVDALKFTTWPEHVSFGWSVGSEGGVGFIAQTGYFLPATVGTFGTGALANTGPVAASLRRSLTSAAGANSASDISSVGGFTFRPALVGFGGFKIIMRFAPAVTIPALNRGFFGVDGTAGSLGGATNPGALLNCIGFGWNSGETTLRVQHNDGAGAATRIDLGVNFPSNDPLALYTTMIWAHPTIPGSVFWWIRNETNQVAAQGEITTDLPANTVALVVHMHTNNGGTAAATRWDFVQCQAWY